MVSKDLISGLPKLKFEKKKKLCDACQKGKQERVFFKSKNVISINRPFQLLHVDLLNMSYGGNYYTLVIVDDYSRYTWSLFLANKSDAFHTFIKLAKFIQNEKNFNIASCNTLFFIK